MTPDLREFIKESPLWKEMRRYMLEKGEEKGRSLITCGLDMEKIAELQAKALAYSQLPDEMESDATGGSNG